MSNHVHLMLDPGERPENLSLLMKRLAGRHSRRLNRLHGWSGSLWEGRFRCSPIDTDRYLLACGRYIDQNPVRARIVNRIEDYAWSSYRARAGLVECEWLDPDPAILDLAGTAERRFETYRRLAAVACRKDELELIRGALHRNQLTGQAEFAATVFDEFGVEVSARAPGRPARRGS
jgi:putative transposase